MVWTDLRDALLDAAPTGKRHEVIAAELEQAVTAGRLHVGERLPTVRQLANDLGVSTATVALAYKLLQRNGLVQGGVGRGTFVAADSVVRRRDGKPSEPGTREPRRWESRTIDHPGSGQAAPGRATGAWRKRALNASASYLRSAYPNSADCSTGRPDPSLLPLDLLRRAWHEAVTEVTPLDLQYAGPEPIPALVSAALPHLAADGIVTEPPDFIVGSSAQQLMVLGLQAIAELTGDRHPVVAVEEPGYPTILDTFERAGSRLVGMEVDAEGVTPEALDTALAAGANLALLTPRAHNPTGASWTTARRAALADVMAAHRNAFAIEDDQFAGLTLARPGSLISDPRIEGRVLYIRPFSKAIAPDLRIAVGVARAVFRSRLVEAKAFSDGWTSRLIQRVLAKLLESEEVSLHLDAAREAYAGRREAALRALEPSLTASGGGVAPGAEGLNIWLWLPPGVEAFEVLEQAAAGGVVAAPGEPFFIRPGRGDLIRMNAGSVEIEQARTAGEALARAAANPASRDATAMVI